MTASGPDTSTGTGPQRSTGLEHGRFRGLRQSFLDGSLTRLLDPDAVLRRQVATFVSKGEFGLGSGVGPDGAYRRLWFAEPIDHEEVAFESSVFLLTREKARELRTPPEGPTPPEPDSPDDPNGQREREPKPTPDAEPTPAATKTKLRLAGTVPPEVWNRLGTRVLPKLRSGDDLSVGIELSVTVDS